VHDYRRFTKLSEIYCISYRRLCVVSARKKDLASCTDILSYARKGFWWLCAYNQLEMLIKKNIWWMYPQGGGEPRKFVCYAM
jgi:hypothetical protein